MTTSAWHYVADGKRRGPVEMEQLLHELFAFDNPREVLVWTEGLPQWVKAEMVEELSRSLPPPIPEAAYAVDKGTAEATAAAFPPPGPAERSAGDENGASVKVHRGPRSIDANPEPSPTQPTDSEVLDSDFLAPEAAHEEPSLVEGTSELTPAPRSRLSFIRVYGPPCQHG
jgi:hypothetical protein